MPCDVRFRTFILLLNPSVGPLVMCGYLNAFKISLDQFRNVLAHFSNSGIPEFSANLIH